MPRSAKHAAQAQGRPDIIERAARVGFREMRAGLAAYRANANGRGAARSFAPSLQAAAAARLALDDDLRDALRSNAFVLHYQPQVERNGHIIGVEALLRWRQAGTAPLEIGRTIIALGANPGLKVLAEGVETEAQRDLFENGCQACQGFLRAPDGPEEPGRLPHRMQPAH